MPSIFTLSPAAGTVYSTASENYQHPVIDDNHFWMLFAITAAVVYGPPLICFILSTLCRCTFGDLKVNQMAAKAHHGNESSYRRFLIAFHPYAGIEPYLFSHGFRCLGLQPGAFEDYLRLICNENSILSMMFCDLNHPFGRTSRQLAFAAIHSVIMVWYGLVAKAKLQGDYNTAYSIEYTLLVPTQILLTFTLSKALTCACCIAHPLCWTKLHHAILFATSALAIIGIVFIWTSVLILKSGGVGYFDGVKVLLEYLYEIMMSSAIVDTVWALRLFVPLPRCLKFLALCTETWHDGKERQAAAPTHKHSLGHALSSVVKHTSTTKHSHSTKDSGDEFLDV